MEMTIERVREEPPLWMAQVPPAFLQESPPGRAADVQMHLRAILNLLAEMDEAGDL